MDKNQLTFEDALQIARGCKDYGGGYRGGDHYEAFQHGIQTVINALWVANLMRLPQTWIRSQNKNSGPEKT